MNKTFKPSIHDMRPGASMTACTADACKGGRTACPCPDACRIPTPMWWQWLERVTPRQFWLFYATFFGACVAAGYLWASFGPR
jgi:hypothetical protein